MLESCLARRLHHHVWTCPCLCLGCILEIAFPGAGPGPRLEEPGSHLPGRDTIVLECEDRCIQWRLESRVLGF